MRAFRLPIPATLVVLGCVFVCGEGRGTINFLWECSSGNYTVPRWLDLQVGGMLLFQP